MSVNPAFHSSVKHTALSDVFDCLWKDDKTKKDVKTQRQNNFGKLGPLYFPKTLQYKLAIRAPSAHGILFSDVMYRKKRRPRKFVRPGAIYHFATSTSLNGCKSERRVHQQTLS